MKIFKIVVTAAAVFVTLAGCSTPPFIVDSNGLPISEIPVSIKVVDEHGRPVPYAEVWRVEVPNPVPEYRDPSYLTFAYLDHVTQRYRDIPEFASEMTPAAPTAALASFPSHSFAVLKMTRPDGSSEDDVPWPDGLPGNIVHLRYSALRYGYTPGQLTVDLHDGRCPSELTITLHRDPAIHVPDAPYVAAYDKARYDDDRDEKDEQVLHRDQAMSAAQAAEAAGDNKFAARIYDWIPYLYIAVPYDHSQGAYHVTGYERMRPDAPEKLAFYQKALALDPEDRYAKMQLLLLHPHTETSVYSAQLQALVDGGKDDLWPYVFMALENAYYKSGQKAKAYELLTWYKNYEPEDPQNQGQRFKQRMARYVTADDFKRDYVTGDDVNTPDAMSFPPWRYAGRAGRSDLMDWLLSHGQKTPLEYTFCDALLSDDSGYVRYLLGLPVATTTLSDVWAADELGEMDRGVEQCLPDDPDFVTQVRTMLQARAAKARTH